MPIIDLPIANGFYVSESLPLSAQRCVNFIPNIPQTPTVTDANLLNTPGLLELASVSAIKTCRGAWVMAEVPYFVIGQTLYRLNKTTTTSGDTFTTDSLGTIEGTARVTMADNGTQLCICARPDGVTTGKSYIFTADPDTLTDIQVADPDFDGPAEAVVYVDGFFVFTKADGKKYFHSQLNDGLNYDAADFGTASADPDQIRAPANYKNNLYIFGSETTEIFRNIGRSPSTFQRIQGAVLDVGIFATQSLVKNSLGLTFIGGGKDEGPGVQFISGSSFTKISTTAIDNVLSGLSESELANVFAWQYARKNKYYYGFTTQTTTFVYDFANKRWHERQSIKNSSLTQFRASHMVTAYGRTLVGDIQDGRIGELQEGLYTEYNRIIRRFITTQPFDNNGSPIFVASIEAVCESGVGLTNDIDLEAGTTASGTPVMVTTGADPQITMAWSKDGGRTYQGYLSRSLGRTGEYKRRQVWRRAPGRIPRSVILLFEITAPVKASIVKVEADVQ